MRTFPATELTTDDFIEFMRGVWPDAEMVRGTEITTALPAAMVAARLRLDEVMYDRVREFMRQDPALSVWLDEVAADARREHAEAESD